MPSKANMRKPALQRNKPKDSAAKFLAGAKKKAKEKVGYPTKKKSGVKDKVGYPVKNKKQGYAAREDESLGMRRGKESTKKQSMKDRRDESYGAWGKRKGGKVNKQKKHKIRKTRTPNISSRG